ncbi:MAG: hypothetical protein RSG95_03040 [Bacilli bacterium]
MNKMEKTMDDISNFIYKSYERRKSHEKLMREGMKFLGECILLPIKEVKESLSEDKDKKTK